MEIRVIRGKISLMSLPFFFRENIDPGNQSVVLDEETSKHIVQVLRMKPGARLQLTNGHGHVFKAEITRDHKKKLRRSNSSIFFTSSRDSQNGYCYIAVKKRQPLRMVPGESDRIGRERNYPLDLRKDGKATFPVRQDEKHLY